MKQVLAKLGVFALIVVNLGAYYVFWPDGGNHSPGADKTENAGNAMPSAATASAAPPADPWKPAPPVVPAPEPVSSSRTPTMPTALNVRDQDITIPDLPVIPEPPAPRPRKMAQSSELPKLPTPATPAKLVAQSDDPTREQLKKLMETFNKKQQAVKPPTPSVNVAPLGMLPKTEASGPAATQGAGTSVIPAAYQAPATAPPTQNSPWTLQWEIADGRTTLTARLRKRLEFRIVGDHVKLATPDGAVVALGKVSLSGPNMKGSCEKLTIGLASDSVTLEGAARLQIQQGNLSDLAIPTVDLTGERFTLRLTQLAGNVVPAVVRPNSLPGNVIPASVNPPVPRPFTLPGAFPSVPKKGT